MEHGGDIYRASRELGIQEDSIIDFSASVNPLGVPESVISEIVRNSRYLYHYPDPEAIQLRSQIAAHYSIYSEAIICGNGSTELIYLVVRALRPERVLIPVPTFSEYEKACLLNRSSIEYVRLIKEKGFVVNHDEYIKKMQGCNAAFICNPNNPTGRLIKKTEMLKIAGAAKELQCYLIIDEAFIDFCPGESMIFEVERNPYLIVLRSMTKFYALSGLRLGYGIVPLSLIKKLKEYKEPWTVNTLAQIAGVIAMKDVSYKKETLELVAKEKQYMEEEFRELGIDYVPSAANFYLVRLKDAKTVIRFLRNKGILVRDCANFIGLDESYIRVAVKSSKDNNFLMKEFSGCPMALS